MSDSADVRFFLRSQIRSFRMPPVHDALVVGKKAPIGCMALLKAVELMIAAPFERISFEEDEIVSDVLIRSAILRRIPVERLRSFVLQRVKPLMAEDEILHVDLYPEVTIESSL
ncbi:MAG: hypothetical protein AB7N76_34870 [Planctomycetota bacterium]